MVGFESPDDTPTVGGIEAGVNSIANGKAFTQGFANILNALQDSAIGLANLPAGAVNTIAYLEEQAGIMTDHDGLRIPYIPSPDWSRDLIIQSETRPDDLPLHGVGKFVGGAGVEFLTGVIWTKVVTGAKNAAKAAALAAEAATAEKAAAAAKAAEIAAAEAKAGAEVATKAAKALKATKEGQAAAKIADKLQDFAKGADEAAAAARRSAEAKEAAELAARGVDDGARALDDGARAAIGDPPTGEPSSVHRVFEEGKPKFQLRKGEDGLSVFDADVVSPEDILPNFRPGSRITTQQRQLIESHGLRIRQTPGDDGLPSLLRDNHFEIQPGLGMSRNQFKEALKKLEKLVNGE